ncbi:MAG: hypothetical protein COB02_10600 [Candidatus Cloacimonadota bacterium]|nr:MAG: hypothetical protein COB02_10600 [Candidatus Cloacimonadota bacterium]
MEKDQYGIIVPINIAIAVSIFVVFLWLSGHSSNGVHESSLAASGKFKVSKEFKVTKTVPIVEEKKSH